MNRTALLATLLAGSCASLSLAATITDHDDGVGAGGWLNIVDDLTDQNIYQEPAYNDDDFVTGNSIQTATASSSGVYFDNQTGTWPVMSGEAFSTASSTVTDPSLSPFTYTVEGRYSGSFMTGLLDDFQPEDPDNPGNTFDQNATHVSAQSFPGYNSAISLIVDEDTPFMMQVSQSNGTDNAYNAGFIYHDLDNDQNETPGDVTIVPYFVVGNSNTETVFGVLAASPDPYRIFFFGNVALSTTESDMSFSASADFYSVFTTNIPEPASMTMLALCGVALTRRRR